MVNIYMVLRVLNKGGKAAGAARRPSDRDAPSKVALQGKVNPRAPFAENRKEYGTPNCRFNRKTKANHFGVNSRSGIVPFCCESRCGTQKNCSEKRIGHPPVER